MLNLKNLLFRNPSLVYEINPPININSDAGSTYLPNGLLVKNLNGDSYKTLRDADSFVAPIRVKNIIAENKENNILYSFSFI